MVPILASSAAIFILKYCEYPLLSHRRSGQPLPDFDLYVSTALSLDDLDLPLSEFVNMRAPPSPYPIVRCFRGFDSILDPLREC